MNSRNGNMVLHVAVTLIATAAWITAQAADDKAAWMMQTNALERTVSASAGLPAEVKRVLEGTGASVRSAGSSPQAKVGYVDGLPRFIVDGVARYPFIDVCGCSSTGGCAERTVDEYVEHATKIVGPRILQMGLEDKDYMREDGTFDFSILDRKANRSIEIVPDAQLIVNIRFRFEKWAMANPDEAVVYGGAAIDPTSKDEWAGAPVRPSAASEKFRDAMLRTIDAMAEHVKKASWGDHVVGVRLNYGGATEWFTYCPLSYPDMGVAMNRAFRRYLKGKYGTDEALRKAWRDGAVTLETASVPPPEVRNTRKLLYDPALNRRSIDYFMCSSEVMTDLLLTLAKRTKKVLPGRLVGVYYGYVFNPWPPESSNFILEKVLASPYIDFFSNPPDYDRQVRLPGGDYGSKSIPASHHRHGKIHVIEDDSRLHYITNYTRPGWCTLSARDDRSVLLRNIANTLFDRGGYQVCDPNGQRGERPHSFDDPNTLAVQREAFDTISKVTSLPEDSGADMALVSNPRDRFYMDMELNNPARGTWANIFVRAPLNMRRSGAVFDVLSLDDLLASKKSYSRIVFLDGFSFSAAERDAVKRLSRAHGVSTLWFTAPGSVCEDGFSDDAMRDLVGMDLRGAGAAPHVECVDLDAVRVNAYGGGWKKSLADGATAYFFPKVPNSAEAFAAIMSIMGEHCYTRAGAYVRRHGDYLMVHVGRAGSWPVELPAAEKGRSIEDLATGRLLGRGGVALETDGSATWLMRIVDR